VPFDTGYSSLAYLRQFPLDFVKIDRSFICELERNKTEAAIVAAIIQLSHALGLTVVASRDRRAAPDPRSARMRPRTRVPVRLFWGSRYRRPTRHRQTTADPPKVNQIRRYLRMRHRRCSEP